MKKGFGFIELLVVLIFLGLVAGLTVDYMKGRRGVEHKSFYSLLSEYFQNDLQNSAGHVIEEARIDGFIFSFKDIRGGYRYAGSAPKGRIERLKDGQWLSVLENVSFMRFTYYDRGGRLIMDEDAYSNPGPIKKVKIDAMIHEGKESGDFFIADGFRGVDLDGDKSNGVARLKEVKFLVDVN